MQPCEDVRWQRCLYSRVAAWIFYFQQPESLRTTRLLPNILRLCLLKEKKKKKNMQYFPLMPAHVVYTAAAFPVRESDQPPFLK